jgi:hypothetical protein
MCKQYSDESQSDEGLRLIVDEVFNYGYRQRCTFCREPLVSLPTEFCPDPGDRGTMSVRDFMLNRRDVMVQNKNREGKNSNAGKVLSDSLTEPPVDDLLYLLKLREVLSADEDTREPRSLPGGSWNTGSESSYLLPTYWFLRCLQDHGDCNPISEENVLPTRLVKIYSSGRRGSAIQAIRLATPSANQRLRYCTLSYRWGHNPLTLVYQNLEDFHDHIPLNKLPITIQQAVVVASRLGFRYIWVDSLCIIQDSKSDWHIESGRMSKIYQNSSLTISAIDAGEDGMFGPRQMLGLPERRYPWRLRGRLDSRGWVLQEETLSRRQLSYTNTGIYWACAIWMCSESQPRGPDGWENSLKTPLSWKLARAKRMNQCLWDEMIDTYRSRLSKVFYPGGNIHNIGPTNPFCQYWQKHTTPQYLLWDELIIEYTSRDLTKESDRLVALKGLETYFSALLNDRFLFCVWEKEPWRLLFWVPAPKPISLKALGDSTSLPWRNLIAPSWSWLSAKGPIELLPLSSSDHFLKLVDVSVEESEDGFVGSISLQGPLLPVHFAYPKVEFIVRSSLSSESDNTTYEPGFTVQRMEEIEEMSSVELRYDTSVIEEGTKGFILPFSQYCLCLVPVNENQFRRVGWGYTCSYEFCRIINERYIDTAHLEGFPTITII